MHTLSLANPLDVAEADLRRLRERPPDYTDTGNARRFAEAHGHDLRYCHPWNRWLYWDGRRFRNDDNGAVLRRAKDVAKQLLTDALELSELDSDRKKAISHAVKTQNARQLRDMVFLAQSEPGIPILPEQLDCDPWLFNVENGTIDLRTGELRPHRREDHISRLAPVVYDEDATCPTWEQSLRLWFSGDDELIAHLQRIIGYALCGLTSEQILIILWGSGENGKTTFIKPLLDLLGDYGCQTPTSTFLERRDSIPNDLAALRGRRLVAAAETGEGRRLNESLVKAMTGGDRISARFMRGEWFEFTPEFTPFLATNHKPEIRGTDHAIWRRLLMVPFTAKIPPETRDPQINEKLHAELPGILAWAVRGCLEWQRTGLGTSAAVVQATAEYRNEQDDVGRFIEECCVVRPDVRARPTLLYNHYANWAQANHEKTVLSAKAFGQRLAERDGLDSFRDSAGRWWLGISIRHDEERDA